MFLILGLYLSSSTLFAKERGESSSKLGIYLCTKDIDSKQSWSSSISDISSSSDSNAACKAPADIYKYFNNTKNDGTFIPYRGLDGKCHAKLRHCFMVQAKEVVKEASETDERVLKLEYKDSHGFGKNKGVPATYTESIFLGEDPSYKKQAVSCELIFGEDNLTKEYLNKYDGNTNKAMNHKWADITSAMDDEVIIGYDLFSHNCCTVAVKAASEIGVNTGAVNHIFDINYGIGTKFTGAFSASSAFVVALLSSPAEEQHEDNEKKNQDPVPVQKEVL